MKANHSLRLLLWVLSLACGLSAQESFKDQYEAALQLPKASPARREAFDRALALFLRLPASEASHQRWMGMAAYSAAESGKSRLARDLYARAWELGQREPAHLEGWVRAMVAASDATAAVIVADGLKAEARYRDVVDRILLDSQLYFPFVNAAAALLRQGKTDVGLWVFQRQADLLSGDPDVQANLGLALRQVGRAGAARAAYERAMALSPRSDIANDLGLLLKGIGERDAAAAVLKRSLSLQEVPGRGSAATNLAVLYNRAGIRVRTDPLADLQASLAEDPQQSLARRVALDLLGRQVAGPKAAAAGPRREPAE